MIGDPCHDDRRSSGRQQAQKGLQACAGDSPQQPLDAVARRAQHRMQPVADLALQMATVHPVVGLEVPNHGLNGVAPLDELEPFSVQPLGLTPMCDGQPWVVGIHAAVTEVNHRRGGLDADVLQQDGGLLDLLVQRMAIKRSTAECTGADDEIALGDDGDAHLGAELKRRAGLALAEAVRLGGVPAVQLGLSAFDLLALGLVEDPAGLGQGASHGVPCGLAQQAEFAVDLPAQAAHDGALTLERLAHALVLLGMRVAPGLAAQMTAFLGEGPLEFDALALRGRNQLGPCGLQHLGVRGVGDGLVLNGGVNDDGGQAGLGDELRCEGHIDRLLQQCFHTLLADGLAEVDQLRGVRGPAVREVIHARKVLPRGRLGPALDNPFVALVEGALEVKHRDNQAQRQARTTRRRDTGTNHLGHTAEQIHVLNVATGADSLGKQVRDRGFQLLLRHARRQHGQRMAQIDHLIQTAAEKVGRVGHWAVLPKTPRKRGYLGVKLGEIIHRKH